MSEVQSMAAPPTGVEHLLTVDGICTLHEVKSRGTSEVLARGPFNIFTASSVQARVGDVSWRLAKDTPVLKYDDLTYTFALSGRAGVFLCLVLPAETPHDVLDMLEAVLASVSALCATQAPPGSALAPPSASEGVYPIAELEAAERQDQQRQLEQQSMTTADKVADGIVAGSKMIGRGLVAMASMASRGMAYGAGYAVQRTQAGPAVQVSEVTRARLDRAQKVAASASDMTGRVAEGAKAVAGRAAAWAAERLQGTSLGRNFSGSGVDGNAKTLQRLGSASLKAVEEVYDSLEKAALMVLTSGTAAAGQVIDHRYGLDAGAASRQGMHAATHVAKATMNLGHLRPTSLAIHTARHTAQGVILPQSGRLAPGTIAGATPVVVTSSSAGGSANIVVPAAGHVVGPSAEVASLPVAGQQQVHNQPGPVIAGVGLPVHTPAYGYPMEGTAPAAPPRFYPAIPQH